MYIFVDESGKPEVYSARGVNLVSTGGATRHLVLAAVKTSNHLALQDSVNAFKMELMKNVDIRKDLSAAYALDNFHANRDMEIVRQAFYDHISKIQDIEIHVIVVEKLKCSQTLQRNPTMMYGIMSGLILQGIAHQDTNVEIIFSRQDNGKRMKNQLELEVERIREEFWNRHKKPPAGIDLKYQHNPHYSHAGLQIADYIAFAVFKYYETSKADYLAQIKKKIRHIYHYNNKEHFTRSRPLKLS